MRLHTEVCDILGIEYPILQGAFGVGGGPRLCAAISNAGGLGVLGAGYRLVEDVREEIRATRRLTGRPFGVNVVVRTPNHPRRDHFQQCLDLVLEEGVPVLVTGAGDPGEAVAAVKPAGVKVAAVTGSPRHAARAEKSGVDIIVCTGEEAGGRLGEVATLPLVPQVVDATRLPVVAGGGVFDGRGMAAVFALGARGVQMGTRFACTVECDAHENWKQAVVEARDQATVVVGRSWNQLGRVARNRFAEEVLRLEKSGADFEAYLELNRGREERGFLRGDLVDGRLSFGQAAGGIRDVPTCRELIERIVAEALAVMGGLGALAGADHPGARAR